MRKFIGHGLLLMVFLLSGCITRVIPYDADRVDQEIKGNRGVVRGKAIDLPEAKRKKTKRMYRIEIELPSQDLDKAEAGDIKIKGNRGYLVGQKPIEEKTRSVKKKKGRTILYPRSTYLKPQVVYQKPSNMESKSKKEKVSKKTAKKEEAVKTYVVQKGDTLQKISDKMYGTTKKWKKIFDANKDILKDPNNISVGQKLVIPEWKSQ